MTAETQAEPLLDPKFLRRLEQWSLAVRRTYAGQYGGERRSNRHGQSIEFADFRNYVPGDDVRFVDWPLYGRLEKLYLKLFLQEQELNVYLLVDLSESMTFGEPSKARMARRLAAAMGYLALAHQDGLSISVAGGEGTARRQAFRLCRGRGFVTRMMWFLGQAREGGRLALGDFVKESLAPIRRPGLVILISDFLEREGHERALAQIIARRHEGIALHVLDREEWEPDLRGDLRLIDAEDEDATEISVSPGMLAAYRRRVREWSQSIEGWCNRRGVTYARVLSDDSAEDVVLKTLRRLGRLG